MMTAVSAVTISLLAFSRAHAFGFAVAALIVISLGLSFLFGLSNTIVQERAPDHLRGRVSAVMGLSFFGFMPVAGLGVTSLADAIGMRTALAASAVVYGMVALFILSRIGHALDGSPQGLTTPAATPEIAAIS
jgi:MFS family permease